MKEFKSGFTLLEVVLVVAISTLLFMSVVIGIGSRIATGRYETASNEITDYLRDVFTVTLNTENSREGVEGARQYCTLYGATDLSEVAGTEKTGKKLFVDNTVGSGTVVATDINPGRTNCAIYGKAIYFGAEDGRVHVFDVIGDTVTNNLFKDEKGEFTTELKQLEGKSILKQLEDVRADIFAAIPNTSNGSNLNNIFGNSCRLSPAGSHSTYEPNWGALFRTANFGGNTSRGDADDFVGMVMIVRAPATGNVHTFFYEHPGSNNNNDVWKFIEEFDDYSASNVGCGRLANDSSEYKNLVKAYSPVQLMEDQGSRELTDPDTVPENTGFCVGSDDFYIALMGLKKYVEFIPGGQNASAVKLNESTVKGENPCL